MDGTCGAASAWALALILNFHKNGMMEENDVIKALSALAQPMRLQVFRALVVVGDSGLTPGAIHEAIGVPPATLSFHLKELVHAGLVTQERASRNLIYRAAYGRMNEVLGYLTENCCQGAECAVDSSAACGC
jgi:DNA-binding transcriptional ArsR family regulator